MTLRIRNWKRFQHFKDRRPPWVKLYRDLLEDPEWHELDGDAAKVLAMLWLLASEDPDGDGKLPSLKKTAFRLRLTERALTSCIKKLSSWLEQDDINVISDRYQLGPPETETYSLETEAETEADCFPSANATGKSAPPRKNGADGTPFPPVPFEKIQTDYNALAADVGLPQCRILTATRKKHISARWREYPDHDSWDAFWGFVRKQPFLTGQNDRGWRCDLEWLMKPSNFAKVCEGSYLR